MTLFCFFNSFRDDSCYILTGEHANCIHGMSRYGVFACRDELCSKPTFPSVYPLTPPGPASSRLDVSWLAGHNRTLWGCRFEFDRINIQVCPDHLIRSLPFSHTPTLPSLIYLL